jgi:NhaA family Na+:H+ antiporter
MTDESPPRRRPWSTVPRLSLFVLEHLLLLPLGAIVALLWANLWPESYFSVAYSTAFAVNDIAMVFFFGLVTKEVVEATVPDGVLHPWRRAWLPTVAALGVTAVPALLQAALADPIGEPVLTEAWPVTIATDVALAYLTVRLIFGTRHPAVPFTILLAIAADAIGLLTLALFDPSLDLHLATGVLALAAAMALAAALRRARVRTFWLYLLGPGVVSWAAFYWSGLHPALALVPIVPFLPHAARDPGFFVDASPEAPDALSQFEVFWRYPAQAALFFFGLVNAGVPFGDLEQGTWALPIAVLVGKPVGLFAGVGVALAAGLRLPHRLGWRDLIVIGLSAAIGLSVGLFFCASLLPPGQLRSEVSMGVLMTVAGLPIALVAARLLRVGRYAR